ncbi:MAG: hypothetical protein ACK44A_06375, partial [Roseateles sp.]
MQRLLLPLALLGASSLAAAQPAPKPADTPSEPAAKTPAPAPAPAGGGNRLERVEVSSGPTANSRRRNSTAS